MLRKSGLVAEQTHRIRLDQEPDLRHLRLTDHAGVIVGGGPGCISDTDAEKSAMDRRIEATVGNLMPQITAADFPFLGCCYGIGILAHHLGAPVSKARYGEPVGAVDCELTPAGKDDPLLAGMPSHFRAFVGHKEAVQALPEGSVHLVASLPCPYQMIRYRDNVYATQFHPEADSDGFELRIKTYADKGYFPPEDAARLVAMCRAEDVHAPERILKAFVERMKSP